MDFQTKCNIVGAFWYLTRDMEGWRDLHRSGDVGLPLAFMVAHGFATATDEGAKTIDDVYSYILADLGITHSDNYAVLDDLLAASENKN